MSTNLFANVFGVFDAMLKVQESEIYAAEWTTAMDRLDHVFVLNEAPRDVRFDAITAALRVIRTADDWAKIVEFLTIDPLAIGARKGEFFTKCPTPILASFIAGKNGVVAQTFKGIHAVETLADNMENQIAIAHLGIDGLIHLTLQDVGEWCPRLEKTIDLFRRLCEIKGGIPASLAKKFETIMTPAPVTQIAVQPDVHRTPSVAPAPKTNRPLSKVL